MISQILVDNYMDLSKLDLSIEDLVCMIELTSAFYQTNCGSPTGLDLHPRKVFDFMLRIREEALKRIIEVVKHNPTISNFEYIIKCFDSDKYTLKQAGIFLHTIRKYMK